MATVIFSLVALLFLLFAVLDYSDGKPPWSGASISSSVVNQEILLEVDVVVDGLVAGIPDAFVGFQWGSEKGNDAHGGFRRDWPRFEELLHLWRSSYPWRLAGDWDRLLRSGSGSGSEPAVDFRVGSGFCCKLVGEVKIRLGRPGMMWWAGGGSCGVFPSTGIGDGVSGGCWVEEHIWAQGGCFVFVLLAEL
ncbi:hypothetical protein RchiOBHm_Chr2g0108911 [Rosa chinensis]|uniref:Uncharacterized protein n=1 Tax=Rosa chinensis TaxID=74649 RepID=A0A2P6RPD5_ROSCH|nr:hypothetical protein RchiOBHm_Chr2g0108911 [Rosa chinensis]